MLNIAIGKGRLADIAMEKLNAIGIDFPEYSKKSRKLIFKSKEDAVRLVFVKASDVDIYVEKGACDIGICGKDTLSENMPDVYEMMDLGFGKCKFAVAAMKDFSKNLDKKMIVATKYVNVAKSYFEQKGEPIEIIKINGSVELAPLMGLSDVIVDIVETGTTLKENGLVVIEEIGDVSARLIVNKASLKTKNKEIQSIIKKIEDQLQNEE
ncbi:MAG: ATP phosphoribosyltransferase [Peptostreptococcales bacterium]